jgi:hypothetical protein
MTPPKLDHLSCIALFLCITLLLPAPLTVVAADTDPQPPADGGWPRSYNIPGGGTAVVYQPQVDTWANQQVMVAWAAVSYQATGATKSALGTIKIEANTRVALVERLVDFSNLRITQSNFPSLSREESRAVVEGIAQSIPKTERVIALERVMAAINKSSIRPRTAAGGLKATAPQIFQSTTPAVLVNFDGEPVWSPIQGVSLKYAVNTNWDLFTDDSTNMIYLRNDNTWLKASNIKGPWSPAGTLPVSFKQLPNTEDWKDVLANIPGRTIAANAVPKVFVSIKPAELILMKGAPQYQPVQATSLLWVTNTESDLFRMGQNGAFYYLISGRWFSAPSLNGPWTFATPNLPSDFQKIPVDNPRSRVLASVPGTAQAAEAVVLAQIPTTARVNVKGLQAPAVSYQGAPQFQPISDTSLSYAVNTDKEIIRVGDLYYMCFQGVWFMSQNPNGPWTVTTDVPKEIYQIPPSSPIYNVTYVTAEPDTTDSDWATFAYTPGYLGTMVAWGCAVWGTGWYYPPYVGWAGAYPAYFWHAPTYGYAAFYNPWTGTYGRGIAAYGPYGGAGMGARYNPATGTYARGAAVYGPYGSRAFAQAYNPRTGAYGVTRQGSNVYGNWGSSYVQRGDQWAQTAHVTNTARGTSTEGIRSSGGGAISHQGAAGGSSTVARGPEGNVYAGHDGNVYRSTGDGFQKWDNGSWSQPARQTDLGQLRNDQSARFEGSQRTFDQGAWRSSGMSRGDAGSFRFGGGQIGGGGFRGRR